MSYWLARLLADCMYLYLKCFAASHDALHSLALTSIQAACFYHDVYGSFEMWLGLSGTRCARYSASGILDTINSACIILSYRNRICLFGRIVAVLLR